MRAIRLLFLVALIIGLVAGSASAAPGQTTHFRFHGTFADAEWFISSDTSFTDGFVSVSRTRQGQEMFVELFTENFDSNGNFTGAIDTFADVTSGFSFTIDARKLDSASTSGSGLPATTCTYDANFDLIGCTDTSINVSASWTGQGPIARETSNDHFQFDRFKVSSHFNGTDRNATASGSIGGVTFAPADLEFADLGRANSGETDICIGNSC
jgi:hypothetical protein